MRKKGKFNDMDEFEMQCRKTHGIWTAACQMWRYSKKNLSIQDMGTNRNHNFIAFCYNISKFYCLLYRYATCSSNYTVSYLPKNTHWGIGWEKENKTKRHNRTFETKYAYTWEYSWEKKGYLFCFYIFYWFLLFNHLAVVLYVFIFSQAVHHLSCILIYFIF